MSDRGVISSTMGLDGVSQEGNMSLAFGWLRWILTIAFGAVCVKSLLMVVYNVYFHPLRNFPGPKLAAATPFPFVWRIVNGRMVKWTQVLHAKYGIVVRIHPDELSFIGSSAWTDIFLAPRPQLPKPTIGMVETPSRVPSITTIPDPENHHRQRKIISHAFSPRALQEQEYILQKWTDLLITRLHDRGKEVDVCEWYNYLTFDVIGDLCFGESFHCLETAENHPWIAAIFPGVKIAQLLTIFHHFPPLDKIFRWGLPLALAENYKENYTFTSQKIDQRIAAKSERPDFMKYILENNYPGGMTRQEINSTTALLVLAGSETSAQTLTGATYFALSNPSVMERLKQEIRRTFAKNPTTITVSAVSELPYMHAVIQETLRMHPTEPIAVPRQVDRPIEVCGVPVPAGVRVGIPQQTAFRTSFNFVEPDTFVPERWLDDADLKFARDDKAMFEPFLVGPRNCIGKPLAWAEMKLTLAKILLNFDLELSEKNVGDWSDKKVFLLNEKKPLYVKIMPRL